MSDARAVQFEADGVSGTVRPISSGFDVMRVRIVARKLADGLARADAEWQEFAGLRVTETFATLCVTAEGVSGFVLPSASASADAIAAGFMAWLCMDSSVYRASADAVEAANAPTNAEAFLPPDMLTDEKKERSQPSAKNTSAVGTSE